MNMRTSESVHRVAIIGALVTVLGLSGCTARPYFDFFNASDAPIKVGSCGMVHAIPVGASAVFQWCGEKVEVQTESSTRVFVYSPPSHNLAETGKSYFDYQPIKGEVIKLQLNTDGRLFAVAVAEHCPLPADARQPQGFPMRPQ